MTIIDDRAATIRATAVRRRLTARRRDHRAYEELMRLEGHLLRDVGLTRAEIPALTATALRRDDDPMLSDLGFVRAGGADRRSSAPARCGKNPFASASVPRPTT
jgi:uncharacterized protein YjiS (DUF1127 family)